MKKVKNTGIIVLVKGISMVLLGIVHFIAMFYKVKDQISTEQYHELLLWFALGGLFFIFIGIIDILSSKGIKNRMNWAWNISFTSAVISCFIAIPGIAVYKQGPPFFILFAGLTELIPLLLNKKEFRISQLQNSVENTV